MKRIIFLLCIPALCFLACNTPNEADKPAEATAAAPQETTEERNIRIIKASVEGINSHNVDVMLKDIAPDAMDYGDGSMPPVKGADSVRAMVGGWLTSMPDTRIENAEYFANDNKVVVISDVSGSWKGDFMGQKATGKSVKYKEADIFTLNDKGQITEHRSVQNMGPVMASMGVKM